MPVARLPARSPRTLLFITAGPITVTKLLFVGQGGVQFSFSSLIFDLVFPKSEVAGSSQKPCSESPLRVKKA